MRLMFLGTSAAEGVPAVFCNCPTCRNAKVKGGRDVRTRSQILIDDDILFDFPMDTYMHMLAYKLDLSKIKLVLITHAHMDHCYPQEFCMRGAPFAHGLTEKTVKVLCDKNVHEIFLTDTAREMRSEIAENIILDIIKPFERRSEGDTAIIAVPASHTVGEDCLVYYVARGGKGALMLNDTGVLDRSVYERLFDMGARVDIATFDCTYGVKRHGPGRHMGLYDVAEQIETMEKVGLFNQGAVKYATHFSHNTEYDYAGTVKAAKPLGIEVAYDGLCVNV